MHTSKKSDIDPSAAPMSSPPSSPTTSSTTPAISRTKQEILDSIASQFGLPLSSELKGLPPSAFPKFPALHELVESSTQASASAKPSGFYEELLGSRPEGLYLDVVDHPEKYEEGVLALTTELVQKPRDLSAPERELLDRAVLSFLEKPRPPLPAPAKEKKASLQMDDTLDDTPELDMPDNEEPAEAPSGENAGAFWWV